MVIEAYIDHKRIRIGDEIETNGNRYYVTGLQLNPKDYTTYSVQYINCDMSVVSNIKAKDFFKEFILTGNNESMIYKFIKEHVA